MNWYYTDTSKRVVCRLLTNGGMESCLVEELSPDTIIDTPENLPPPAFL